MNIVRETNRVYVTDSAGKILAYVTFPMKVKGIVDINHTFVDSSLRGQGVASILMENAYEVIKGQNLKAVATCSYAISWFEKNRDRKDILD